MYVCMYITYLVSASGIEENPNDLKKDMNSSVKRGVLDWPYHNNT